MQPFGPGPPEPGEYDAYYAGYVERIGDAGVLRVLEDQIGELTELLRELGESDGDRRYAAGKWSIKEVLGHVIDTERIFGYRALSIARGEAASLPGFDQDDYAREGAFDLRSLGGLIDEYQHVRRATLALFCGLDETAWTRKGVANGVPVTVRALAYIVAGHQAHHTAVLRERYLS